jgi:hypothetical protein
VSLSTSTTGPDDCPRDALPADDIIDRAKRFDNGVAWWDELEAEHTGST